ncbi:MAG: iron chelate uptake ABC transporter family permease subunit [Candidatus Dasytiphilus stammeri]
MFKLILPSWIAASLLAVLSGPLGSFVIWRKMSYIGETMAHISLLGIAISLYFNIHPVVTILVITIIISSIIIFLETNFPLHLDTILGIIAQSSLSIGIIIISIISHNRKNNFMNYFIGNLKSIKIEEIITLGIIVSISLFIIIWKWNSILSVIIHPELAHVEGISVKNIQLLLILLLAITISISIKLVGALLITSMLIIPAASAQFISRSPEQMVIIAIILGIIAVTTGTICSFLYSIPSSPTIIVNSTIIFIIIIIIKIRMNKNLNINNSKMCISLFGS